MKIPDEILRFIEQLGAQFSPQEVILFGSHARGDAQPHSDVDLLVILNHSGRNVTKAVEILKALKPTFSLDLLVRKPEDISRRVGMNDYFIQDILTEGKTLYGGDHSRMA